MQQPDSNLVWGILVAVLCCLPFGIVSIIQAAKVSGLWAQGRYAEAQKASDDAKKWAIWGVVAGVVVAVIYAVIAFAAGGFSYICPRDRRPFARRAVGSRRCRGGRVRGYLVGRPDGARRDPSDLPHQGPAGHRLSRLRQPADDLLVAAPRRVVGRALQRPRCDRGADAAVGVCRVGVRQAGGQDGCAAGSTCDGPLRAALALTLAWFVVRNLEFGPFAALHV